MEEQYCFDISFPSVDFELYMKNTESCLKSHHAHLISRKDEIEIKIYYQSKTYFGRKLSLWLSKENWKKVGLKIQVENETVNSRISKIDLSESYILKYKTGSNQNEEKLDYVSVFIDKVKIYWEPVKDCENSAEFYLNDSGFKMVSEFYAPMFGFDGEFKISRMNGKDDFYSIGKAEFKPEFNFAYSDSKSNTNTNIIKEPFINFKYNEKITEEEAIKYADIVCFMSSFYFHTQIDYSFARIHLPNKTITIKRILSPQLRQATMSGLWGVKYYSDFHSLLSLNWQNSTLKNANKLAKVIGKFNQALIVDGSSQFLIRYNIIEVCMGGNKKINPKFNIITNAKEYEAKYIEALNILLKTIDECDYDDFKVKWSNVKRNMVFKPMISPLEEFLIDQKLKPKDFPIKLKKLIQIRSDLTHGSINRVNKEQLEKANAILYRITLALILNLLGIDKWEFDNELS